MKQQGFKYTPGESVSDFIKNNTKTGKYQKITLEERTRTEEVVDMTKNLIEEYARLKNRHTQILSPIKATRDSIYDMAKNLDLIKEIQLDSSNKDIPSEEIDSLLIDLIYESINRTRVNKEISKLKEAKLNYNAPTKEKKDKTSSTNNIQDRVETAPIIIDTESFHYFGINGATLKNISESKEKYESAKYFLSSLETIFYDAGLDEKQIAALVSKNPHLLFESKSKMTQHLNLIERLYDLINPLKVSGIQPTLNSEIYTSEDSLNKIIKKEESKSKKINILNIELIDDDKDRQTFENRMNCINTRDERIQKYISRKAGTKTILYEKYSSEFGEGTYMKGKLGKDGRRVIYKIEPTENTINIRIINYFKNHDQHMDFFKPR